MFVSIIYVVNNLPQKQVSPQRHRRNKFWATTRPKNASAETPQKQKWHRSCMVLRSAIWMKSKNLWVHEFSKKHCFFFPKKFRCSFSLFLILVCFVCFVRLFAHSLARFFFSNFSLRRRDQFGPKIVQFRFGPSCSQESPPPFSGRLYYTPHLFLSSYLKLWINKAPQ